jgi:RNA polymerase sigma-70 factor, ECF subfamily
VRRARAGLDLAGSFRVLEARLGPRLLQYFRCRSFSPEDAEDLVQGVLAQVWQGLPRLQQEDKFLAWAYAIARNMVRTARARRRRERRWVIGDPDLAERLPDPQSTRFLQERLEAERIEAMKVAIASLPSQQRECLLLRVREELSYEEISETLRLSLHTVRNHLAAARKKLRQLLGCEAVGRR